MRKSSDNWRFFNIIEPCENPAQQDDRQIWLQEGKQHYSFYFDSASFVSMRELVRS